MAKRKKQQQNIIQKAGKHKRQARRTKRIAHQLDREAKAIEEDRKRLEAFRFDWCQQMGEDEGTFYAMPG
jgi:hypothetical protein